MDMDSKLERASVVIVACALVLYGEAKTVAAAPPDLVSYFNRHAIGSEVPDYGDRVVDSVDRAARDVGRAMESMALSDFAKVYDTEELSCDARFLMTVTWIRIHCDSGKALVDLLTARRAKKTAWPAVNCPLMDDGLFESALGGYYVEAFGMNRMELSRISFLGKQRAKHALVVGVLHGSATSKSERIRYRWWFLDTAVDPRLNVTLGRRIERGWYVTKKDERPKEKRKSTSKPRRSARGERKHPKNERSRSAL